MGGGDYEEEFGRADEVGGGVEDIR